MILSLQLVEGQVSTRYVYDASGQLVRVIQGDGTMITYDYDVAGNVLRRVVTTPDAAGAVLAISPISVEPASVAQVTVFGSGLADATAVSFDHPGLTATFEGPPEANALFLSVRVEATAPAGPHSFSVLRANSPAISSGKIALNVAAVPILLSIAPSELFTGNTVPEFTLTGARFDHSPTVAFDKAGLTITNVTISADGTSLSGRLQVALTAIPGSIGVSVTTSEGTTKKRTLRIGKSVPGLTGSYFGGAFTLDGAGLPVIPGSSPSFIRSDAALQFGTSKNFAYRPCFVGAVGCLNGAYTVRWQGYIVLEQPGNYAFALNSSDASQLFIDGSPVVSNPGSHAATTVQGQFVAPNPGSYPVVVLFNTSGKTPGIDLLYQPPGAEGLLLVPGSILWSDGSVYDPVLTSALSVVSVFNPAAPISPGGSAPLAGASAAISFFNPAATPAPGGTAPVSSAASAVSFFSPGAVLQPGGTTPVAATTAVVSFTNPASVIQPGGTAPLASAAASVSFSNPASVVTPGGSQPLASAAQTVAFAAGPTVHRVSPLQLSRAAGGGVLTITGTNLQGATTVLLEGGTGIGVSAPAVSANGTVVTATITLTPATPTGFVGVRVSTPSGTSATGPLTVLEIVP
jgi:YD repeat-containing protein